MPVQVNVRHGYAGLMVRVDDPGELRVSGTGLAAVYKLQAGEITRVSVQRFEQGPRVQEWLLGELSSSLIEECSKVEGDEVRTRMPCIYPLVRFVWSQVLLTTERARHGGAFVVLPGSLPPSLRLKFTAGGPSLGDDLTDYWCSCVRANRVDDRDGFGNAIRECWQKKHQLFSTGQALGQLSAVDGCVVLDRTLNLLGFGGKIQVDDGAPQTVNRSFVEYPAGSQRSEDELKRFGTRHNSAFRLCKAHANVIAFVISQDGGLRVFASDEKHVYFSGSLSPAVHHLDES